MPTVKEVTVSAATFDFACRKAWEAADRLTITVRMELERVDPSQKIRRPDVRVVRFLNVEMTRDPREEEPDFTFQVTLDD